MAVLDCESYDSALESICGAHGLNASDVASFLLGVDLDAEYETKPILKTADKHLVDLFQSQLRTPISSWDTVCWFHLTRVPPNTDFSEGILPLHLALAKIWQAISVNLDSKKRDNLEKLRQAGVPSDLYWFKTENTRYSGPYAMLVRESAFHARSMGHHDYLKLPEIVEDICRGYEQTYHEPIYEEVAKNLQKCIVKFESSDETGPHLLAPALLYCWCKVHGRDLSLDANTCYDAVGATVPQSAIRKIEFL